VKIYVEFIRINKEAAHFTLRSCSLQTEPGGLTTKLIADIQKPGFCADSEIHLVAILV
jgi:hypothetical protein